MLLVLAEVGLKVEKEPPVKVYFRGHEVGVFKIDILVERLVLLELKATKSVEPVFEAQVLNYLRATKVEIGLLFNF